MIAGMDDMLRILTLCVTLATRCVELVKALRKPAKPGPE
jgi:hypothetical protein